MPEEEREGYWTPFEKSWRDFILRPITWILGFIPYAANCLTIAGFFVFFWAIIDFLYYKQHIKRQIRFLTWAWITDFLDGPTARNNNNVTALGTAADHGRDHGLSFWMIFLSFIVTKLFDGLAFLTMFTVLTLTVFGMLGIIYGTWSYSREKRHERPNQPRLDFIHEFLLKDVVTTVTARIHTFILALGDILYLAGTVWDEPLYTQIGAVLLIVQLVPLGFYLHELLWQKYEDKTYKMRLAMQRRIEKLEGVLQKFGVKTPD